MDMQQLIMSMIFLVWGITTTIVPEKILKFRTWTTKIVYGADFKPSKRTVKIQRFLGIIFILFGIFLFISSL